MPNIIRGGRHGAGCAPGARGEAQEVQPPSAFDIESDGSLINQRTWAELDEGVVPDGCALDAEGAIWLAAPMTNELIRVHEGGRISERIKFSRPVIACALGGPGRRTLFVISSDSIDFEECRIKRPSRIDTIPVAVSGAPLALGVGF
jgi:sugar lactone lactonase YvrE